MIESEPKVGTRRTARDGSQWVKVRMVGERVWADALCSALFAARVGGGVTENHLAAMGYEPASKGPSAWDVMYAAERKSLEDRKEHRLGRHQGGGEK